MIRPLRPADVAAVARIDADLFGADAWSRTAWEQEAAQPDRDRCYLVLTDDSGAVLGYAGLLRAGSDADVLTVAVARESQRQGLGRHLLAALLAVAGDWRCLAVFLEVAEENSAARAMYRAAGFADIGNRRHYYGPDRHAVVMRKQVREPMGALAPGGEGG